MQGTNTSVRRFFHILLHGEAGGAPDPRSVYKLTLDARSSNAGFLPLENQEMVDPPGADER